MLSRQDRILKQSIFDTYSSRNTDMSIVTDYGVVVGTKTFGRYQIIRNIYYLIKLLVCGMQGILVRHLTNNVTQGFISTSRDISPSKGIKNPGFWLVDFVLSTINISIYAIYTLNAPITIQNFPVRVRHDLCIKSKAGSKSTILTVVITRICWSITVVERNSLTIIITGSFLSTNTARI